MGRDGTSSESDRNYGRGLVGWSRVLGELLGGQPGLLHARDLPNSVGQWQWPRINASSDQPRMRIDRSHIWYVDFVV